MKDINNLPSGNGRLRALLASLGEPAEERLTEDPRYKEGWDDGYDAAQARHKILTQALAAVYNVKEH